MVTSEALENVLGRLEGVRRQEGGFQAYCPDRTTLDLVLEEASRDCWRLYPIWPVDEHGVCACLVQERCGSPGKHPTTPNGVKDASSDPQEIARMFSEVPGANVGLATGKASGVVVLDNDEVGCGGSYRWLHERYGPLPPTRVHRTGSGNVQEFYRYPSHLEYLPSKRISRACELKADGVGVVLPPSVTDRGAYEILDDREIAPLPSWVVDFATGLTVIEGGAEQPTASRFALPERIREGKRWDTLWRYGCSLRAHGRTHAAILAELRRVAREVCDQPPQARHPLTDSEIRKAARYAARHEPGYATTARPEALAALDAIDAAVWARPWTGVGGKSERSVVVALIEAGRLHGELIPAGVRVSIATRPLAENAGMPHRSLMRAVSRLRRARLIRKDDLGRRPAEAGAFVLLHPGTTAARASCHHSTTLPTPVERLGSSSGTESVSDDVLRAPRLRWGYSLGKGCEALLDALQKAGGEMKLKELAGTLGAKRPRDLRRRNLARLEAADVVAYNEAEGTVLLREDWLEALDRERTMSGEKKAENLDRAEHERQREGFRQHLAEKANGKKERTGER